jgi:tRNA A-37 threonylcarbamoyl transferase component Bud32
VDRIPAIQRAIGDTVSLKRLIGTGGFAEVYEGTDNRLDRAIAVKVLREDIAAPRARERFLREARAAAQVRHPNVLSVYDVGEQGDIVWFTMPLVTGESLRARLDREKRIAPVEVRRILIAASAGLHAAHRARLVHRDVKPDNILLDGPERLVLLADFGVAASQLMEEGGDRITTEGAVVGTPRYMSPEQAAGEPIIDARADVYSLGVVGYEMIAGEPPFTAANAGALLAKHLTEPVTPLRSRAPECPVSLAEVIERALEKDPADRWPTADAFLQALEGRVSSRVSRASMQVEVARPRLLTAPVIVSALFVILAVVFDLVRGAVQATPFAAVVVMIATAIVIGGARLRSLQQPVTDRRERMARRVRRARALRTAARALLAVMPKAESARFGSVGLEIDQLVFGAEQASLAGNQDAAIDAALAKLEDLHALISRGSAAAT